MLILHVNQHLIIQLFETREEKPGMVVHDCNPSVQEAEEGGLRVQGQLGPHGKPLLRKKKKKREKGRFGKKIGRC
jgi:hypothetical protein